MGPSHAQMMHELATQRAAAHERKVARRQRRRDEINSIRVPMAPTLKLAQGTNGAATAQSDGTTIYVDGQVSDQVMAHEAAHNLDAQVMTDADRKRFAMILGKPNAPWERVEKVPGAEQPMTAHDSTEERFADMVSMLATRKFPKPGQGGGYPYLDKPPSVREILRFGRALERLGRRNNLARYRRPQ